MLSSEHNGQCCGAGETGVGGRGRVQSHLACLAVFTADSACCQTTPAGRLPNQKPATRRATARQTKVQALTARLVPVCQKKETSQRIYKVRRKPGISIMTFYHEVSGLHGERTEEKLPERSSGKPLTSKNSGRFRVCGLAPGLLTSRSKPLISDTRHSGW